MSTDTLPPPMSSNQTVGTPKDNRPRIRISSHTHGTAHNGHQVTIGGLDPKEFDLMEGSMHGHNWVTVNEQGRLRSIPTYKPLPNPVEDKMMLPFWRPIAQDEDAQLEMFELDIKRNFYSASIIIQSLCGYHYTPEKYREQAESLQAWGFECLRSRRRPDGRFWEVWMLNGLTSARGELKLTLEEAHPELSFSPERERHKLDVAIDFLCRYASFGTLDATIQRAAMTTD